MCGQTYASSEELFLFWTVLEYFQLSPTVFISTTTLGSRKMSSSSSSRWTVAREQQPVETDGASQQNAVCEERTYLGWVQTWKKLWRLPKRSREFRWSQTRGRAIAAADTGQYLGWFKVVFVTLFSGQSSVTDCRLCGHILSCDQMGGGNSGSRHRQKPNSLT